ncbi:YCII domain-containing protein [Phanerochaete sordida]|uniref:YCII domain-containing protein n=1 Tax=Phanerochaete sordida TaxID=48140 RepID=A0A9P3GKR1_9APHY|nr:YCII domain-containing protein [Phanerochaete sordida]
MSTATKHTFAVYAPDYTDPEAFSRRMAVRATHLVRVKSMKEEGLLRIGGVLADPETYQSAEKKLVGSMLIFEAESLEAVRKIIEEDIYWSSNVWDKEKVVILPWIPAFPLPPLAPQ